MTELFQLFLPPVAISHCCYQDSTQSVLMNNVKSRSTYILYLNTNRLYWGADKFLARPGRKQARKHVRDPLDFNNIETRAVI